MKVNRGKQFETQIRQALEKYPQQISVDRFADPMAAYAGVYNTCDFGAYQYPLYFYLECKAFSGNTLNFRQHITEGQWKGLEFKSKTRGVHAGIIIWFIDHDVTAYVPIQEMIRLKDGGCKSLNIKHLQTNAVKHYIIPARKKKVLFEYDMKWLLDKLGETNE